MAQTRVVAITGASAGIGRATAIRLHPISTAVVQRFGRKPVHSAKASAER